MSRHQIETKTIVSDDRITGSLEAISKQEAILRREIVRLMQERDESRVFIQENSESVERFKALTIKQNETICHLEEIVSELQNTMVELDVMRKYADLLRLEADQLRNLDNQHRVLTSAIYAASSWRVSAPLRLVATILRTLCGKTVGVSLALPYPPPETTFVTTIPNRVFKDIKPTVLDKFDSGGSKKQSSISEKSRKIAANRRGRGDLLVAADMPPLFDQQAGGLRLYTILNMLAEAGWTLTFASLTARANLPDFFQSDEGILRYEEPLRRMGIQQILYGLVEIDTYLQGPSAQVDWAFLSFPNVASTIMPLVRVRFPQALVAFDMVDFHSIRMAREAELQDDLEKLIEAKRMQSEEVGLALAADVTITVTAEEREALLALAPQAVVKVLPCIFDTVTTPEPILEHRAGLFFIGGFWHAPNADGIKWFVDQVWPLIRMQIPNVTLRIAGSSMGDDILALGILPGIEVLGYVPEIEPLLRQHRISIAPLRFGAGMKGKVAQSLANGLPVVSTTIGAEGMGLIPGIHILVADDKNTFAEEVVRLLQDDHLWQKLSMQGRDHIDRTLSSRVVRDQLDALFNG